MVDAKNSTVKEIYSTLVKFLGEPPKNFKWSYTNTEDESNIICDMTPFKFMDMVMPSIKLDEFYSSYSYHYSDTLKYNEMYEVKYTNNIQEGDNFKFLNLHIEELFKYVVKSISAGIPVWFAADVSHDF